MQLFKNSILHSIIKHIDIKHHFLHDHVSKGNIINEFIVTTTQLANIFTKTLDKDRFSKESLT